jgi:hypothetical protein
MNTEDKFYFRRATDSEIENLLLEAESLMDDGFVSKAIPYLRKASNSIDTNTSPRLKKILSDMMREANVRFSRPGQPERFAAPSEDQKQMIRKASKPSSRALSQLRNVVLDYARHATQDPSPLAESDYYRMIRVLEAATRGDRSGVISNGNESGVRDDIPVEIWYWAGGDVLRWSKPGQPDKFDASSVNRGDFSEASMAPMLGTLLEKNLMPEGGWRAVKAEGNAVTFAFEDGDIAGNFARRVAAGGYTATAPIRSFGQYWEVEVQDGK